MIVNVSSHRQVALTVCALRRLDMDYKVALNTSATPVFQLVKFQYDMDIEGIDKKLEEQRLLILSKTYNPDPTWWGSKLTKD